MISAGQVHCPSHWIVERQLPMTVIKRGLNLPISGAPDQKIEFGPVISHVGILGDDYVGMKPTMLVSEGDTVKRGQKVIEDKKTPGVFYTSPVSGKVSAINRGAKRKFLSIVISVEGDERIEFSGVRGTSTASLGREKVVAALLESGLFTAFRVRPFGHVPEPLNTPHSIFVTAMDTSPLAADPVAVMAGRSADFVAGLEAISQLTDGKVYVCQDEKSTNPGANVPRVQTEVFSGPHPAGLAGTHIHFLDPVGPNKTVWYLNYQDVIAIGSLMLNGVLDNRRVVSLAGPVVTKPRLIETVLGASIDDLVAGQLVDGKSCRVISGSVLCGRKSEPMLSFLGRYHSQISVIEEGTQREFLGWQKPGFEKYSVTRVFASAIASGKKFAFTTSTEGSERAMVPLGTYEKVMPMDLLPTQLLRALIVRDTEQAQQLGALELEEEDVALCTFVCPGKYEYGTLLRDNLTTIQSEG